MTFQKYKCWNQPLLNAIQEPWLDLTAWGVFQENITGSG
jgi:hypothetical protein